jgi:PKD repeat protein
MMGRLRYPRITVAVPTAAALACISAMIAAAGALSSVSPTGASAGVPLNINGTGFNAAAAQNEVTFTPVSGAAASAVPTRVLAGNGLLMLTVTVPTSLPAGRTALRVTNRATGEVSQGLSFDLLELRLSDAISAPRGATLVNVQIQGSENSRFVQGSTRAVFGSGVTVHSTTVTSPTSLIASISVAATAALGARPVGVTSPNQQAVLQNAFTITDVAIPPNHAPTANAAGPYSVQAGVPLAVSGTGSDTDAGDSLSFSWSFGDGSPPVDQRQTTHTYTTAGTYTATLTVRDGKGGAATSTAQVTVAAAPPPNNTPVITSSAVTAAIEGQPYFYKVVATDADLTDVLTFTLAQAPPGMTIGGTTGEIGWTPTQLGPAPVTVHVSDGKGGSADQSFTITTAAANHAPVITSVPVTAATEGQAYTYQIAASDPDPDTTLGYELTQSPSGMTIEVTTGSLTWTPAAVHLPSAAVTVRVSDGKGGAATQSFTIVVTAAPPPNQNPSFSSTALTSASEGQPYAYQVTATDPDVGNTLAYELTQAPTGMSIDPASGLINWTPVATHVPSVAVTVRVSDGRGGSAIQSFVITVAAAPVGRGVIAGRVFDDSRGLPIENAHVQLLTVDGNPPVDAPTLEAVSDRTGRFRIAAAAGIARLRVTKGDHTAAERAVRIAGGKRVDVFDARLTPLDGRINAVASVGGAVAVSSAGDVRLTIAAASLPDDAGVRLTRLSAQGLEAPLPLGWSPVAAVDVFPPNMAFASAALLTVPTPAGLPDDGTISLAVWDDAASAWISAGAAQRSLDGKQMQAALNRTGQYAFVMADAAPDNPAPAVAGERLPSVLPRAPPADLNAAITPSPRVLFAQPGARSHVGVLAASSTPILSGTPFVVDLVESYNFSAGGALHLRPTEQRLALYAFPAGGAALNRRSDFLATPSREFAPFALRLGAIDLAVRVPADPAAPIGKVIGGSGGSASAATGERVSIPAGAAVEDLPVVLTRLEQGELPLALPAGLTFVGALTLDLHGGSLVVPATLSVPSPGGLAAGENVLVVQLVEADAESRLALVAVGAVQGTEIVTVVDPKGDGSLRFPGARAEGRYAFVRADAPIGFLTGLITGDGGAALSGALVRVDSLGLVSLTDGDGRYILASPLGEARITAKQIASGDTASATTTIAAPDGVASLPLSLGATPPVVVAVTPANGSGAVSLASAVRITFSEPIDPTSLAPALSVGEGAAAITGTVSLAPGNAVATFRPTGLLHSQTTYQVRVAGTVRDVAGNPMGTPFVSQFSTVDVTPPPPPPAGAITATIPDANGTFILSGTQGTVDPGGLVLVRNLRTGATTTLTPNANGSFSGTIAALRTDRLEITIADAAGNKTTVPIAAFRNADGAIVVGTAGGRVEGPGGVAADIPAGALPDGTIVRVVLVPASELPLPAPSAYPFTSSVRLELGGVTPLKEIDLSIPAPPGAASSDHVVVARPVPYRGTTAWTVVERAHLDNGRYTTASFPFQGVLAEGTYSFLRYDDGCLSYVAVRVRMGIDTYAAIAGVPFVFPAFDVDHVVIPAPCGSSLNIQLTEPNFGELIQQISRVAPATADDIAIDPQIVTDDSTAPVVAEVNNPTGQQTRRVELTFSELMDPASVCDGLTITDSAGQPVPGHVFGCPPPANAPPVLKAVFFPATPFEMGEKYTVVFNGAKDIAGNPLAAEPFIFTPFDPKSLSLLRESLDLRDALEKCAGGSCSTSTTDQALIGRTLFIANGVRTAEERYTLNPPRRLLAVDVSDPSVPKLIGWHETTTNPRTLAAIQGLNSSVFQGDLVLVAGGGRVEGGELAGKLEVFDVRACTVRPVTTTNCLDASLSPVKGGKFLSTPSGGTPRAGVPVEAGVPLQMTILHDRRPAPADDTLIAYINVVPIGIEAVDIRNAFNAPFTPSTDFAPDKVEYGDFLDVAVLRNRVVAIGPTLVGGEPGLRVFSAELNETAFLPPPVPAGLVRFPGLARLATAESVVIDVDGDGNLGSGEDADDDPATALQEVFDLAVLSSGPISEGCIGPAPCGELYVVDLSSTTALLHQGPPDILARIPLPGPAFSVQIDGASGVAYVEVRGRGLVVVDLTHLQRVLHGEAVPPDLWDANNDGADDRILRVIARTDIFATDLKIDLARGLAFVNGSSAGLQIVQVSTNCTELALDFKPKPAGDLPTLEQEKRILTGILNAAAQRLLVDGGFNDVGLLEQGSGSCFWRTDFPRSCTSFIPGTSDHDIEVFVPQGSVAEAQGILDQFINSRPSGIQRLGALTLFAVAREPFEDAELLNGTPRNSSGDPSGDLAMGRQLLLLLWILEGEYVDGHQGTLPALPEILLRFKQKHTSANPIFPGEPSGIPRLEGYEWSVLQEYNFYKSGAMVRIAGACAGDDDVSADVASDEATDPARNFVEDELRAGCQEELHLVAKGAIRSVLARLAAADVTNPTILQIDRENYRKTACLTGVTDPRSPPADPNAYTEKPCGSFEEYIVSVAVRSVRAGHGVFQAADLSKIFTFYCAKVGENCANREGQRIVGPLFQSDAEANRFVADAIRFIEEVQGQTFLVYNDTLANDTDLIGEIPFFNDIAGVCGAHGVLISREGPRSDLRRCNRAIVQRKTNGNQQEEDPAKRLGARNSVKKNFRVRALNQGGGTVDVQVAMYEGDGLSRAAYTEKKRVPLGRFGGGEIRYLDEEDDPGNAGRKRPTFPATFDLTVLAPGAARAIAFYIDPDGDVPETNRADNQAGFFYYALNRVNPDPPSGLPAEPESPSDHTAQDSVCVVGPKIDFDIRAFGGSNTNLRGSREVSIEVGQTLQLMYRVRNVGSEALHNVSVRSSNGVVGDAVSVIPPGQDAVVWDTFAPPPGTSIVRGTVLAYDAAGNSLAPALDAIRIVGHSPSCEADIQSLEPDPNPFDPEGVPLSTVGLGGSLFRYYRVMRNGLPAAGTRVIVRVTRSHGQESVYVADTDADGLLTHVAIDGDTDPRGLKLDASLIGSPGESATVQVEEVEGAASTCGQKFAVLVTERDYSRSLKGGASLEVSGALVGLNLKGKAGMGFEYKADGDTSVGDRAASLSRLMSTTASAGLKGTLAKGRVNLAGTFSVAEAELAGALNATFMLRDKHTFAPLSGGLTSDHKLAIGELLVGLIANSSLQSTAGATGPAGPLLALVLNELTEQLTGLDQYRESVGGSVGVGAHVSGTASGPKLSFRKTGIPILKNLGFEVGAEGSADVAAFVHLDLGSSINLTGEYRQAFDLSAKLGLSLLQHRQLGPTKPVLAKGVGALQDILAASGGAAGTFKVSFVAGGDPLQLQRIIVTISHQKKYGFKVVGFDLVDEGSDDVTTLKFTISDKSKFPRVFESVATLHAIDLAMNGIPAQVAFSPTALADEIVNLLGEFDSFEETVATGSGATVPIGLAGLVAGTGAEASLEVKVDTLMTTTLRRGTVTSRDLYTLERYPATDPAFPSPILQEFVDGVNSAVEAINSFLTVRNKISRAVLAVNQAGHQALNLFFSPSGVDLVVNGAAEPEPFTINLLAFKYQPETAQGAALVRDPSDVTGPLDGAHYGVGGFFNFSPVERPLSAPAPLTIRWEPHEISGFDENSLGIYRWNNERFDWDYLGGTVNPEADSVTVAVDRLGLYTAAPPMPAGRFDFTGTAARTGTESAPTTTMTFTSSPLRLNTGGSIPDGTLFTVRVLVPDSSDPVPFGEITTTDLDPATEGIQVAAENGAVRFSAELPGSVGRAFVLVNAVSGTAVGEQTILYQRPQ